MRTYEFSTRALASMVSELERFPKEETGGLLLGIREKDKIYVIEATGAGKNAIHEISRVSCDMENLNYIAKSLIGIYQEPVEVVGIWHKHNHAFNPPFSEEDKAVHKQMLNYCGDKIVSALFEKEDDESYSLHVYTCGENDDIEENDFEVKDLSNKMKYRSY